MTSTVDVGWLLDERVAIRWAQSDLLESVSLPKNDSRSNQAVSRGRCVMVTRVPV